MQFYLTTQAIQLSVINHSQGFIKASSCFIGRNIKQIFLTTALVLLVAIFYVAIKHQRTTKASPSLTGTQHDDATLFPKPSPRHPEKPRPLPAAADNYSEATVKGAQDTLKPQAEEELQKNAIAILNNDQSWKAKKSELIQLLGEDYSLKESQYQGFFSAIETLIILDEKIKKSQYGYRSTRHRIPKEKDVDSAYQNLETEFKQAFSVSDWKAPTTTRENWKLSIKTKENRGGATHQVTVNGPNRKLNFGFNKGETRNGDNLFGQISPN